MTHINLIAAVGKRGQLGLGGHLPWHDLEDLKWFKDQTMGGVVVVGPKTALTLPSLPGRSIFVDDPIEYPKDLLPAIMAFNRPIWIAGGAGTYRRWLPFVRRSVVTHIDYDGPADVFMPPLWRAES